MLTGYSTVISKPSSTPIWFTSGPAKQHPTAKTTCPTNMRDEIAHAAEIIRRGGLVAFPTETVYGLGSNALDEAAIDRIYWVKGRPPTSPLIVHVNSVEMANTVVRSWPATAQLLAARFWPGPLTLVLPKATTVPKRVTAGLDT